MGPSGVALLLAAAALCLLHATPAGATPRIDGGRRARSGLSEAQKQWILDYHNEFRRNVSNGMTKKHKGGYLPTAMNMFEMKWDEKLAKAAQKYADKCVWKHDPHNADDGENLASNTQNSLKTMIDMWTSEVWQFPLTSVKHFAKKDVKKLGHATAMMWWDTDRVGCGLRRACRFTFWKKKWTMNYIVCRYGPMGNIYERPIYAVGRTCAHCKKYGKKCDLGLCVDA